MSILVVPFIAIGGAYALMRSPYVTGQSISLDQPIPSTVPITSASTAGIAAAGEKAAFAGMPPTTTC